MIETDEPDLYDLYLCSSVFFVLLVIGPEIISTKPKKP